jgi:5-methylcytosine-specific restriction endonuclease McrA
MNKRIVKPKTTRVPKIMNAGTMTQSAFFQWLRHVLRKASVTWKPIAEVRREARIPYKGKDKRRKYMYICANCGKEFKAEDTNVHHVVECGSLNSFNDLPSFVEKLFVEKAGLVLLCNKCHNAIHNKE